MAKRPMINPNWTTMDPAHMALGDFLAAIGDHNGFRMCRENGLALDIIKNIKDGQPVAEAIVTKIATWLSAQYARTITPDDIANVNVLTPGQPLPDATYTPEPEFAIDQRA